jgi:spore coat polysaccharide biosynthesis protein SpsF (cytidylyltransferase family)
MLNLLLNRDKSGLVVTRMKSSRLSGTQVEKFLPVVVLRIEYVSGSQKRPNHILFFTTLNAECTKFNGVVQELAILCLQLVDKMVG